MLTLSEAAGVSTSFDGLANWGPKTCEAGDEWNETASKIENGDGNAWLFDAFDGQNLMDGCLWEDTQ